MNLYIEGSKVLHKVLEKQGAVKTLVYSSQYEKKPQLLGLVCETLKYSSVLQQLVEKTKLLTKEHLLKGDSLLAQTLVHDYVVGRDIRKAGRLKQIITRNKAALSRHFETLLTEAGVETLEELVPRHGTKSAEVIPRYVRVNLLKSSVSEVIRSLQEEGWFQVATPDKDSERFRDAVENLQEYEFLHDPHLFDLLVFPPRTDFHDNPLLTSGRIILQDKASCFPAHILAVPEGASVIDCCAAPGNKTSHIASLIHNQGKVFAFDKDGRRMATLQRLMRNAGVTCVTSRCQDFLKVDTEDECYRDVQYMLVDPSCSGSGIVSRLNDLVDEQSSTTTGRLDSLSNFQVVMLKHAMKFPNLKRVVYSTCSIHPEENEEVIKEMETIVKGQFKICKVLPDWPERGIPGYDSSDCFLRMSPKTSLCNGFFVACFERIDADECLSPAKISESERDTTLDEDGGAEDAAKKRKMKHKVDSTGKKRKEDSVELEGDKMSAVSCEDSEIVKKHKKKKKHKSYDSVEPEATPSFFLKTKNECHSGDKSLVDERLDVDGSNILEEQTLVTRHKKKHKKHKSEKSSAKDGPVELEEPTSVSCPKKKHKKKKHDENFIADGLGEHLDNNDDTVLAEEPTSSMKRKRKKQDSGKSLADGQSETEEDVSLHKKKKKKHKHSKH